MIFFDASIPRGVPYALQQVRDDVIWLGDRFPLNTPDTIWLAAAGAADWIVYSRDKKIRSRPAERQAIVDNEVACFIITVNRNLTRWEYLKLIARTLDDSIDIHARVSRPFIWTVETKGIGRRIA